MRINLYRSIVLSSLFAIAAQSAFAVGVFPDVGDTHPFKAEIESLARAGIVKGNPSGKFEPDRSVNRAEFLKLLYTAVQKTPKPINGGCFKDVEKGSWYELYVCDAAAHENSYVKGYPDLTFRPANPVSRTEALKMMYMVFGLPTPDVSTLDKDIIKFADLSVSAWYTKYVSAAYRSGIFPIASFTGVRFYPEKELTRGEAAAYIVGGLRVRDAKPASSASSSKAADSAKIKNVVFPFNENDQFAGKQPVAYLFDLTAARTVVSVMVSTVGTNDSDVSCRLYLLEDSGFTNEYYLGIQEKNRCRILANVRPGKYQLQLQASVADQPYFVDAKTGSTDGNDGFIDAQPLTLHTPVDGSFDGPNDLFDWYTFSVTAERNGTVFVGASERLECIIYSPDSVDQFGFSGPQCGLEYFFQTGTYTVGVGRRPGSDLSKKISYTLRWR